jgi:hypothetical protein
MKNKKKRLIKPPERIGGTFQKNKMSVDYSLSTSDLIALVKASHITDFRGIFTLDTIPRSPKENEKGIVNIPVRNGSHWVCYIKKGKYVRYFNSIGNKPPPKELITYFKDCRITFNKKSVQERGTSFCGYHCLNFLIKSK